MGLGHPWDQEELYTRLADGLARGEPVGADRQLPPDDPRHAPGEPRRMQTDRLEDLLPTLGTALFTHDPDIRFVKV